NAIPIVRVSQHGTVHPVVFTFNTACAIVTGTWLAGSFVLLGRFIVAARLLGRARRDATAAPPDTTRMCAALAREMNVSAPRVLISSRISSPCLVGLWRPLILIPADGPGVAREVIAHELAHLARKDWAWLMISRVICAILWVQPLLWILARWMERAAD